MKFRSYLFKWASELDEALKQWQNETGGLAFRDRVERAALAHDDSDPIIAGIRNETFNGTIYRGLSGMALDDFVRLEEGESLKYDVGNIVELTPQSFSLSETVALDWFAGQENEGAKVLYVVKGGGHGIVVGNRGTSRYRTEKEVITGGKFKVTGIKHVSGVYHIGLKQVGIF
jgi:hypothetical protein